MPNPKDTANRLRAAIDAFFREMGGMTPSELMEGLAVLGAMSAGEHGITPAILAGMSNDFDNAVASMSLLHLCCHGKLYPVGHTKRDGTEWKLTAAGKAAAQQARPQLITHEEVERGLDEALKD